jgi:hypothetical protein
VIARTQLPVEEANSSIQSNEIMMHVEIAAHFLESASCENESSTKRVPTSTRELNDDA